MCKHVAVVLSGISSSTEPESPFEGLMCQREIGF